jgi:surfeit locus 1 family protein
VITRRVALLALPAIVIAAVCIRLGFWQLGRLAERRAENARIAASIAAAPIDVAAIPRDSAGARGQQVTLRGTYDFANELVLTNRSRDGAPGVNLLTPLRIEGRDTAVIVNRGWIYSPDGSTIDATQWREPPGARGTAYVSWLSDIAPAASASAPVRTDRRVLRLDRQTIAAQIPYPIAPYQLVVLADSGDASGYGFVAEAARDTMLPVRLPLPALDEGPHKSYAIQWFCFAAIAIFGTGAVIAGGQRRVVGPSGDR